MPGRIPLALELPCTHGPRSHELTAVDSGNAVAFAAGLDRLAKERFDSFLAYVSDRVVSDDLRTLQQARHILAHVADGIVVVDYDLRIRWANPTFLHWCGGEAIGRSFYEALHV